MLKHFFLIFFLCLLFPNENIEKKIFNYSFKNINPKISKYSFTVLKSDNNFTKFQLNWLPSENLIISTNYINDNTSKNSSLSENNFYYGINFTLLLKENMYSGFGINTIKFDNTYNTLKWVEYFFDKKFNFKKNINFNFGLSYLYRENNSFFKTNVYLNKEIYYNFIISFGYEGSISSSHNKIYIGINYFL